VALRRENGPDAVLGRSSITLRGPLTSEPLTVFKAGPIPRRRDHVTAIEEVLEPL
jgi:hypothetical protein